MLIQIRIQGGKPMRIHEDLDPGHKKWNFYKKNMLYLQRVIGHAGTSVYLLFWSISLLLSPDPHTDPDLREPSQVVPYPDLDLQHYLDH
jgi:hypothetical protein